MQSGTEPNADARQESQHSLKLVVLGATGGTGLELVKQALGRGHAVTAFVRLPERLRSSGTALTSGKETCWTVRHYRRSFKVTTRSCQDLVLGLRGRKRIQICWSASLGL